MFAYTSLDTNISGSEERWLHLTLSVIKQMRKDGMTIFEDMVIKTGTTIISLHNP